MARPARKTSRSRWKLRPAVPSRRNSRKIVAWSRQQHERTVTLSLDGLFDRPREKAVPGSDGLRLVWLSRPAPREALDETLVPDGAQTVNVYLVNTAGADHRRREGPEHGVSGRADGHLCRRLRAPAEPERLEFVRR